MGKFELNRAFVKEMAAEGRFDGHIEKLGLEVLAKAEELSWPFYDTGDWQLNLNGELKHADGWPYYRVEDLSEAAVYIEFGTSKTPAHRALGRAIGSAGSSGGTQTSDTAKARRSAAAKARWAALSDEEKRSRVAKMQAGAAAARAKKKATG